MMAEKTTKKAVFATGGKQYIVSEGDVIEVDLLKDTKKATFDTLMVIEGDKVSVGRPLVEVVKIAADITEQVVKAEKVIAIRFKAKKRVKKVRGHRQRHTQIKITKIRSEEHTSELQSHVNIVCRL